MTICVILNLLSASKAHEDDEDNFNMTTRNFFTIMNDKKGNAFTNKKLVSK